MRKKSGSRIRSATVQRKVFSVIGGMRPAARRPTTALLPHKRGGTISVATMLARMTDKYEVSERLALADNVVAHCICRRLAAVAQNGLDNGLMFGKRR